MSKELIERLRTYAAHHNSALLTESADTLEAADKRIAELEAINGLQAQSIGILAKELDEAERKLAVARESMRNTYAMLLGATHMGKALTRAEEMLREALVQIGGGE